MGTYAIEPHIVGIEKKEAVKKHIQDTYLLIIEMGAQQQDKGVYHIAAPARYGCLLCKER